MTLPESVSVLVIGGGPAGLAAALELGVRGIDVLILEPRDQVSPDRPRAKTTSARTMEHLRRWGLADQVRQAAPLPIAWSQDAAFVTALLGTEITRFTDCFAMSPARREELAEPGQQVAQPLLESLFRDAVAGSAGSTLATGWSMVGLREYPDHVVVQAQHEDGTSSEVRAQYVLGCDGSRSRTRPAIGARYEGSADARTNFNVVFRAPGLLEKVRLAPAVHYWVLDPEVPGLVGPLDLCDTWWGMAMGVDAETGDADPAHFMRKLIGPGAESLEIEIVATDPWTARMLLADTYGGGRVFLVGDAAHLNPPWGGHGFNTAIGDAVNIAWKISAVLESWAGPDLLQSYEAERRPIAQQTIDLATGNMRTLSTDLADPQLRDPGTAGGLVRQRVAEQVQATKDAEFHSLGLVLGYCYDQSPVVDGADDSAPTADPRSYVPSTRPGARLPHAWLPDGRSLFDLLGRGMTLVRLDARADTTCFQAAAERLGVPLQVVDASDLKLPDSNGFGLLLVRPDQHIAWRSNHFTVSVAEAEARLCAALALTAPDQSTAPTS